MKEQLERDGLVYLPKFFNEDFCNFLHNANILSELKDGDCPVVGGEFYKGYTLPHGEALLIQTTHMLQHHLGPLYPAYSYARVYLPGNTLGRHVDRGCCEIGMSLTLTRQEPWAFYITDKHGEDHVIEMDVGDAVVYKAQECEHWRPDPAPCESGHFFMFFVYKDGDLAHLKYDEREVDYGF